MQCVPIPISLSPSKCFLCLFVLFFLYTYLHPHTHTQHICMLVSTFAGLQVSFKFLIFLLYSYLCPQTYTMHVQAWTHPPSCKQLILNTQVSDFFLFFFIMLIHIWLFNKVPWMNIQILLVLHHNALLCLLPHNLGLYFVPHKVLILLRRSRGCCSSIPSVEPCPSPTWEHTTIFSAQASVLKSSCNCIT